MGSKAILDGEMTRYGRLFIAIFLAFFVYFFDQIQAGKLFPQGLATVLFECFLEVGVLVSLRRFLINPALKKVFFAFCFILPADFSYLVFHYVLKGSQENLISFLLTTLPYSFAYALGSLGFIQYLRQSGRMKSLVTTIWLPMVLIIPVFFEIILPLVVSYYYKSGWNYLLFGRALNSIFAVTFFFSAVMVLVFSLDSIFTFLALGGVVLQLGNWGIAATLFQNKGYGFTEYEFLWLCGVVVFWYGAVVESKYFKKADHSRDLGVSQSLVTQQRLSIIGLISFFILVTVKLLPRDVWSYRIAFFGVALGCVLSILLGDLLAKQIVHYSTLFGKVVKGSAVDGNFESLKNEIPLELWQLYQAAFEGEMIQYRVNLAVGESLGKLATQVAHDIRSPLAALDNVARGVNLLPEGERLLIRTAINRIRDIANNLIQTHKELNNTMKAQCASVSEETPRLMNSGLTDVYLLSSLIDPLITEKRMEFRSKIGVEIDARFDSSSYGLFSKIQPIEFKRVLSNLINNAVEALEGHGSVVIALKGVGQFIEIRVTDNGCGIPDDVLLKLGKRGSTHGKQGGSGLGLFHAQSSVETWGGNLMIESQLGQGTSVVLMLLKALSPEWFVSELRLNRFQAIVILDDDLSVHNVWEARFKELILERMGIDVLHFSTPSELTRWVSESPLARSALYLMDFELLGYEQTGLDLIESLNLQQQSILVTSRFEEKRIQEECARLKIRLVPKSMVAFVPISVG